MFSGYVIENISVSFIRFANKEIKTIQIKLMQPPGNCSKVYTKNLNRNITASVKLFMQPGGTSLYNACATCSGAQFTNIATSSSINTTL